MAIASLLSDGRTLRDVDHGIVSALPAVGPRRPYDRWAVAAFYDGVVATRAYNRVIWGTTPDAYIDFERRAITSRDDGVMLDAACGSLAFTANLFAGHRAREVVLLDYSLGMLRRARRRIEQICGSVPSHLTLLHADIHDLPFRDGVFSTVSFPAALHEFRDPVDRSPGCVGCWRRTARSSSPASSRLPADGLPTGIFRRFTEAGSLPRPAPPATSRRVSRQTTRCRDWPARREAAWRSSRTRRGRPPTHRERALGVQEWRREWDSNPR